MFPTLPTFAGLQNLATSAPAVQVPLQRFQVQTPTPIPRSAVLRYTALAANPTAAGAAVPTQPQPILRQQQQQQQPQQQQQQQQHGFVQPGNANWTTATASTSTQANAKETNAAATTSSHGIVAPSAATLAATSPERRLVELVHSFPGAYLAGDYARRKLRGEPFVRFSVMVPMTHQATFARLLRLVTNARELGPTIAASAATTSVPAPSSEPLANPVNPSPPSEPFPFAALGSLPPAHQSGTLQSGTHPSGAQQSTQMINGHMQQILGLLAANLGVAAQSGPSANSAHLQLLAESLLRAMGSMVPESQTASTDEPQTRVLFGTFQGEEAGSNDQAEEEPDDAAYGGAASAEASDDDEDDDNDEDEDGDSGSSYRFTFESADGTTYEISSSDQPVFGPIVGGGGEENEEAYATSDEGEEAYPSRSEGVVSGGDALHQFFERSGLAHHNGADGGSGGGGAISHITANLLGEDGVAMPTRTVFGGVVPHGRQRRDVVRHLSIVVPTANGPAISYPIDVTYFSNPQQNAAFCMPDVERLRFAREGFLLTGIELEPEDEASPMAVVLEHVARKEFTIARCRVPVQHKAAVMEVIERLETEGWRNPRDCKQLRTHQSDEPIDCAICQSSITKGQAIVETCCKHLFHVECWRGWDREHWAKTKRTQCPACRTTIGLF